MLPALSGRPIRVEIRKSLGRHLAAASIPRRLILLDREVLAEPGEFERILIHELFHFAWLRLPNSTRFAWEKILAREIASSTPGELGWSAQWRKEQLDAAARRRRSPAWRRYACESFCDTAAWLYSGLRKHGEFTLAPRLRRDRKEWFHRTFPATAAIPI